MKRLFCIGDFSLLYFVYIVPVAHSVYGIPQAINSANYVYFLALEKTLTLGHKQGIEIFTCTELVILLAVLCSKECCLLIV